MWFAALGSYQHNPWFLNLIYRLLNGEKAGSFSFQIFAASVAERLSHLSPKGFVVWSTLIMSCIVLSFAVLELMGKNPFPGKPPKYIRAQLYHYYYTSNDKQNER